MGALAWMQTQGPPLGTSVPFRREDQFAVDFDWAESASSFSFDAQLDEVPYRRAGKLFERRGYTFRIDLPVRFREDA